MGSETSDKRPPLALVEELIEAPAADREEHRLQRFAAAREVVLRSQRMLAIDVPFDDAGGFELLEAVGEDARRHRRLALEELLELRCAEQHVADDQQRPAIADDVERLRDWAHLAVAAARC